MTETAREPLPWPTSLGRDDVDEVMVVVSDVEIGPGGPTDDFPQSEFLGELLLRYCEPPFADLPVTVVFDGDTFDLLKTPHEDGSHPVHITEEIALAKLEPILAAHGPLLEALRRLLGHRGAPRRLSFVVGNHDMELFFEGVQRRIREALGGHGDHGGHDAIAFPGIRHVQGQVHVEHGQQHDPLFAIDPERPFIEHEGRQVLNLPWGTVALLDVAMDLSPQLELRRLDRLKPKASVLEALPEVRELLLDAYWRYWTRDFWQSYWRSRDPLRRVSWTMLKEVAYRLSTGDADVSMRHCEQLLHDPNTDARLIVLGHEHEPAWWNRAGRRVLRTGCFRNEYELDPEGRHRLLPKVYAEAFLRDGRPVRSHLVEVDAPLPAEPAVPSDFGPLLEEIRARRAPERPETSAQVEARAAQERAEAEEAASRRLPGFIETLRNLRGRA